MAEAYCQEVEEMMEKSVDRDMITANLIQSKKYNSKNIRVSTTILDRHCPNELPKLLYETTSYIYIFADAL